MIIKEGYKDLSLENCVVALGVFDGMHRGHTALVKRTVELAKEHGLSSVVLTFDKHPRMILRSTTEKFRLLNTLEEKQSIIEELGVDYFVVLQFTKEFSMMSAPSFIKNVLVDGLHARYLVVGRDHRFGYDGSGNDATIDDYSKKWGIYVEHLPGLSIDGVDVSSSRIREMLSCGDVEESNDFLGRHYSLSGKVVKGKGLGHVIGFPTANVKLSDKYKMIPADGVYAVEIFVEGKRYNGMMSIGNSPTIKSDSHCSLEVHIFDFHDDIYGKDITVSFVKFIRHLIKFDSVTELSEQLTLDKQDVIAFFDKCSDL